MELQTDAGSRQTEGGQTDRTLERKALRVEIEAGVAFVSIRHAPLNALDALLMRELEELCRDLEGSAEVRVVVFKSDDPEFFISHADIHLFLEHEGPDASYVLDTFRALTERFRRWDKVTIGQVEGRASGAGTEFLEALDMRFAALGRALLSHPEVSLGFLPCKGGTQRLPALIGRARALELMLGGSFLSAELAERYGLVNRALMPVALAPFVRTLALRIASWPAQSVQAAKQCVQANTGERAETFDLERQLYDQIIVTPESQQRLRAYYDHVGQRREVELRMGIPG